MCNALPSNHASNGGVLETVLGDTNKIVQGVKNVANKAVGKATNIVDKGGNDVVDTVGKFTDCLAAILKKIHLAVFQKLSNITQALMDAIKGGATQVLGNAQNDVDDIVATTTGTLANATQALANAAK